MYRKRLRLLFITICIFCILPGIYAQYTVAGRGKTPLMAYNNTPHRIQVYLVYGTSDAEISYTSSSTSHKWYRYKGKALEAEAISSRQNGNTSTVINIEDGYGYFVEEPGQMKSYIWIIDYSRYAFDVGSLRVAETNNQCSSFMLTGEANISPLIYYTPNGEQARLNRSFEVSYSTLVWMEDRSSFSREEVTEKVEGDPFARSYNAPLCDTHIRLSGDLFARHFGVEKSAQADDYAAIALEVHADTVITTTDAPNMNGDEGLSAPASISFRAIANEPVAALYIWTIYRVRPESEENEMLIRYTGNEVEYTFTSAGEYYAELEVADRSTSCTDAGNNFSFTVSDYYIDIPNVFTPGSTPDINDEFRIAYKSIYNFKGWIFNKWGAQLFHWTDPSQGWDGKKNGKYVAPGAYYYIMEFEGSDGKKHKRSGDINILRPKNMHDEIIQ